MDEIIEGLGRRPKGRRPLPPREKAISIHLTLYPHQIEFLDRDRNISAAVQALVEEAMAREQAGE